MRNQRAAVEARLSDPDFQGRLVNRCIGLTIAMAATVCVLVGYQAYQWAHPAPPRYFFTDGKHAPRPVVALDSPIVDDPELLDWAVKAILAPYNVDYYNYPVELNTASRRFTPRGWNTFARSFIAQGNFEEIKRARLLCHAQAQRAAVIHQTRFVQGRLAYRIQFPMMQTCENVNQTSSNNLMMTALVIRTNDDDHPDGLAIDQLVASPH
ncbi:MAG: DotI/IcmL/TraM family protein [Acetobacteraceae bacterium]